MKPKKISFIIPCLNEANHIKNTLIKLQSTRQRGHEVIISDGGSSDKTMILSQSYVDIITQSASGRSTQMNTGAKKSTGDILCFLHADTIPPDNIDKLIINNLNYSSKCWGRFNLTLSNKKLIYRIIETFINIRSCISGIATGDQGVFTYQKTFIKLGGFKDIPLMEDIELSKRLNKISRPVCINKNKLITSSRRWEKHGVFKTILLMWNLRLRYFLGTSPDELAKLYKPHAE